MERKREIKSAENPLVKLADSEAPKSNLVNVILTNPARDQVALINHSEGGLAFISGRGPFQDEENKGDPDRVAAIEVCHETGKKRDLDLDFVQSKLTLIGIYQSNYREASDQTEDQPKEAEPKIIACYEYVVDDDERFFPKMKRGDDKPSNTPLPEWKYVKDLPHLPWEQDWVKKEWQASVKKD